MTAMTATMPADPRNNGKNLGREKETIITLIAIVPDASRHGGYREPVRVRVYSGRSASASAVYCSIWAGETAGHGRATGYGYHKASAALQAAIDSAGITLSSPIDGRGEGSMREAVRAIAAALGYPSALIVEA